MKYILLFDRPSEGNFLLSGLMDKGLPVTLVNSRGSISFVRWLRGCLKALSLAREDDVIICWFDFQAILCFFFSRFFLWKRNKILAINLLLKKKKTFKNFVITQLYRIALNSDRFAATATSSSFLEDCYTHLGKDIKIFLLHDVNLIDQKYEKLSSCACDKSVFVGGKNGRDWSLVLNVAQQMENVEFHLVGEIPHKLKIQALKIKNVNIYSFLPYEKFLEQQASCLITFLPLTTESPAGLIVLFQAAVMHRMVVMTESLASREYIIDGERGAFVLKNDVDNAVNVLSYYLSHTQEREKNIENMNKYVETECSSVVYVDNFFNILKMLGWISL